MPKLRKQRRRKLYRHSINRKRLRNKIFGTGNIACKEIKNVWENKKSVETNLAEMGLSYDPNKTIKIPNNKRKIQASLTSNNNDWIEEANDEDFIISSTKSQIVEVLEADAKAPRERKMRLPNSQVEGLTYLILQYGKDYKAMARDKKNYYQETWKQIRQKIKRFRSIPEQYSKFLKDNNLRDPFIRDEWLSDDEV